MYSTISGVKLELQEELYTDTEIDTDIEDIDAAKVIIWIDGAVGRSFSEDDLIGDDTLMRLAACKYGAYSMMSSPLEGHNIDTVSLALHRLGEAKEIVKMWARPQGIIPTFIDEECSPVATDFAVAVGTDSVVIG